jgi:hypothetical protein
VCHLPGWGVTGYRDHSTAGAFAPSLLCMHRLCMPRQVKRWVMVGEARHDWGTALVGAGAFDPTSLSLAGRGIQTIHAPPIHPICDLSR